MKSWRDATRPGSAGDPPVHPATSSRPGARVTGSIAPQAYLGPRQLRIRCRVTTCSALSKDMK